MGDILSFDINVFLASVGTSPFDAMLYIFLHGGWVFFAYAFIWMFIHGWLEYKQIQYVRSKEMVCLAIDIPKNTEKDPGQALRGVENIFAHLAGAHSSISWTDKWMKGVIQDEISLEIISIEGRIQFIINTVRRFRDLVEASIYAQYPEAQIVEVEDYAKAVPTNYPDREWDLWGTEMYPAPNQFKSDLYPIKTYPNFEHSMSGELKDPLAVLLEGFSRLGPGEQAWLQFILIPIEQVAYKKKGEALIKKLKGEKETPKQSLPEMLLLAPFNLFIALANGIIGGSSETKKPEKDAFSARIFNLTPGERKVLEAVEVKVSKIAYLVKVRFIYAGKKAVFKKPKAVNSFIGFMKQMNTNDMLSLKPDLKKVGLSSAFWFFKDARNNLHKNRLIKYYRGRSAFDGNPPHYFNCEEIATYWHFPHTFQVRAPQLKKIEVKSVEPPYNLPIV
ncbi:MAG: hypothetical protein PHC70_01510 [Patescibacteria group bacterium]|nr:hypothetical protein [Patescibacteria group bacterium]